MFVSDKITYVELHKTGCTHIRKLLSNLLDGELVGVHNYPPEEMLSQDRIFLGSVRNPWDWYVSIWAFGCDHKGGIYERVTGGYRLPKDLMKKQPFNRLAAHFSRLFNHKPLWERLYSDVNNVENFRRWLRTVHHRAYRFDWGENYAFSPVCKYAGLITYRYMKFYCKDRERLYTNREIKDYHSLKEYTEKYLYIHHFIRNENLEDDLIRVLGLCGITLDDNQKQYILNAGKTNISSRTQGPEYYYDEETIEIVRNSEKFIIEKFGYQPPVL